MNYLEWVNQDVKRSYRYRFMMDAYIKREAEADKYRKDLEQITAGIVPEGYFSKEPNPLVPDIFHRERFSFLVLPKGMKPIPTIDDFLPRLSKEREHEIQLEVAEKSAKQSLELYSKFADEARQRLDKVGQKPVHHWLTMDMDEWSNEFVYRIMDFKHHHPSIDDLFNGNSAERLEMLVYVLDECLSSCYGIETIIRFRTGFTCTMRDSQGNIPITVTRRGYNLEECLLRTALTFIDLAWEHFTPG